MNYTSTEKFETCMEVDTPVSASTTTVRDTTVRFTEQVRALVEKLNLETVQLDDLQPICDDEAIRAMVGKIVPLTHLAKLRETLHAASFTTPGGERWAKMVCERVKTLLSTLTSRVVSSVVRCLYNGENTSLTVAPLHPDNKAVRAACNSLAATLATPGPEVRGMISSDILRLCANELTAATPVLFGDPSCDLKVRPLRMNPPPEKQIRDWRADAILMFASECSKRCVVDVTECGAECVFCAADSIIEQSGFPCVLRAHALQDEFKRREWKAGAFVNLSKSAARLLREFGKGRFGAYSDSETSWPDFTPVNGDAVTSLRKLANFLEPLDPTETVRCGKPKPCTATPSPSRQKLLIVTPSRVYVYKGTPAEIESARKAIDDAFNESEYDVGFESDEEETDPAEFDPNTELVGKCSQFDWADTIVNPTLGPVPVPSADSVPCVLRSYPTSQPYTTEQEDIMIVVAPLLCKQCYGYIFHRENANQSWVFGAEIRTPVELTEFEMGKITSSCLTFFCDTISTTAAYLSGRCLGVSLRRLPLEPPSYSIAPSLQPLEKLRAYNVPLREGMTLTADPRWHSFSAIDDEIDDIVESPIHVMNLNGLSLANGSTAFTDHYRSDMGTPFLSGNLRVEFHGNIVADEAVAGNILFTLAAITTDGATHEALATAFVQAAVGQVAHVDVKLCVDVPITSVSRVTVSRRNTTGGAFTFQNTTQSLYNDNPVLGNNEYEKQLCFIQGITSLVNITCGGVRNFELVPTSESSRQIPTAYAPLVDPSQLEEARLLLSDPTTDVRVVYSRDQFLAMAQAHSNGNSQETISAATTGQASGIVDRLLGGWKKGVRWLKDHEMNPGKFLHKGIDWLEENGFASGPTGFIPRGHVGACSTPGMQPLTPHEVRVLANACDLPPGQAAQAVREAEQRSSPTRRPLSQQATSQNVRYNLQGLGYCSVGTDDVLCGGATGSDSVAAEGDEDEDADDEEADPGTVGGAIGFCSSPMYKLTGEELEQFRTMMYGEEPAEEPPAEVGAFAVEEASPQETSVPAAEPNVDAPREPRPAEYEVGGALSLTDEQLTSLYRLATRYMLVPTLQTNPPVTEVQLEDGTTVNQAEPLVLASNFVAVMKQSQGKFYTGMVHLLITDVPLFQVEHYYSAVDAGVLKDRIYVTKNVRDPRNAEYRRDGLDQVFNAIFTDTKLISLLAASRVKREVLYVSFVTSAFTMLEQYSWYGAYKAALYGYNPFAIVEAAYVYQNLGSGQMDFWVSVESEVGDLDLKLRRIKDYVTKESWFWKTSSERSLAPQVQIRLSMNLNDGGASRRVALQQMVALATTFRGLSPPVDFMQAYRIDPKKYRATIPVVMYYFTATQEMAGSPPPWYNVALAYLRQAYPGKYVGSTRPARALGTEKAAVQKWFYDEAAKYKTQYPKAAKMMSDLFSKYPKVKPDLYGGDGRKAAEALLFDAVIPAFKVSNSRNLLNSYNSTDADVQEQLIATVKEVLSFWEENPDAFRTLNNTMAQRYQAYLTSVKQAPLVVKASTRPKDKNQLAIQAFNGITQRVQRKSPAPAAVPAEKKDNRPQPVNAGGWKGLFA